MPSSFGTGLISGVVDGWTKQSEQMDQAKRAQQQKNIENNLAIMNSRDVPDDVRSSAAQQLQDLMQGKKPGGKGGGQLSPVLQNLLKMIGKSHGDQGQSSQKPGGMTENMPNGQPAPGTAGSQPGLPSPPPLNTDPQTGRPSLQGTGNAAADPTNAPQPAVPGAQPPAQSGGNTLDQQIAKTQDALQQTKNPYTRQRLQSRLDTLMDSKAKNEAEVDKEARTETGKESLQRVKDDAAKALQDLKDKSAKDIADAKLQGAKEEKEARAKADRDLEEQKEKNRETLKKVIPGKAAGSGGSTSKATERRFRQIEDEHQRASLAATNAHSKAMTAAVKLGGPSVLMKDGKPVLDADGNPKLTPRGEAEEKARKDLDQVTKQIEEGYKAKIKQATKGGDANVPAGRVKVTAPNGSEGHIPASQLDEWNKMTPEQQNQATQKKAA